MRNFCTGQQRFHVASVALEIAHVGFKPMQSDRLMQLPSTIMNFLFVYFRKLCGRVVVNFEPPREPRIQPRVGAEKTLVQVLFVTGHNDHEVGPVIAQRFAQRVNALLGKGVALVGASERVRFINE